MNPELHELARQGKDALAAFEQALKERRMQDAAAHLQRLEELARWARYVVLARH